MYKVYKHKCPNGKVYIGITSTSTKQRWKNGYGYIQNKHFYYAIKKYGWENIEHEVLFRDLSFEQACEEESKLIEKYNSANAKYGYNKTLGGKFENNTDNQYKLIKQRSREKRGKPVILIIEDRQFFKEFPDTYEWRYYDVVQQYTRKGIRYMATKIRKQVFDSMSEASEKTGFTKSMIYNSCKKQGIVYEETRWMYYEEYLKNKEAINKQIEKTEQSYCQKEYC